MPRRHLSESLGNYSIVSYSSQDCQVWTWRWYWLL